MLDRQVGLPDRRLAHARQDHVDVGRRDHAVDQLLGVRIRIEDAVVRRASRITRDAATCGGGDQAVVGERVAQPDVQGRAREQADAAADLGRALGVEAVVEAEARLDQVVAVDGDGVVDAEAASLRTDLRRVDGVGAGDARRGHRGVAQRTVAGRRTVVTDAVGQLQVAVDRPGVLQEQAGVGQGPVGGGVTQAAALLGQLGLVLRHAAALEVFQHRALDHVGRVALHVGGEVVGVGRGRVGAGELVNAEGVLQEGVVDVVARIVGAELHLVVTLEPGGAGIGVPGSVVELVHVTAALRTEVQGTVAGAGAGRCAGRQRAREHQGDRRQGRCQGVVLAAVATRQFHFGREVRGPVAEQLGDRRFEVLVLGVLVGGQRQRAAAVAAEEGLDLRGLLPAEACAVVVVDVPVDLQQAVFDFLLGAARHLAAADVHAVLVLGDVLDLADGVLADADVGQAAADRTVGRRILRAARIFGADEHEQLVLDQRAAQGQAAGLFLEFRRFIVGVAAGVVALADHAVVAVHVVHAAVPLVGARLGDGVDVGAGVALLGHVVVRDVDLHRLDRVDRDRLARGRQAVRFQAEGVGDRHAVDGDRVEARVLAAGRDFAAFLVGLRQARILACVVGQRTGDRRLRHQLGAADVGARTHVAAVELVRLGLAGDVHDGHFLAQGRVDSGGFRQVGEDVVDGFNVAVLRHGDRERTADAQAACDVATFGIGGDRADRTRLGVADGDLCTCNRLAVRASDAAADGGGGVLCEGRRSRQRNRQSQRQLGQPDLFVSDHC